MAWLRSSWHIHVPFAWLETCVEWVQEEGGGARLTQQQINQQVQTVNNCHWPCKWMSARHTHCYKTSAFPGVRPVAVSRSEGPGPPCTPRWSVWGPKDWAHRHILCSSKSCICNVCSNIVSIYTHILWVSRYPLWVSRYPQYMSTGIYIYASVSQVNWWIT